MDPRTMNVDALLDRLSEEVARRFAKGGAFGAPRTGAPGPPFCAICTAQGTCAKSCPDSTQTVVDAGAARVSSAPGMGALEHRIAAAIDHTLLKPEATRDEVTHLCAEAVKYGFASVCVNPFWVPLSAKLLQGHPVMVCTVVGFPLGANRSETKADEAARAVAEGAHEIDMVINIGALKSGMADVVEADIRAVREAIPGTTLKVILETSLLDDHQKVAACEAAKRARADFVKTSTGFSTGGATAGDIALMRRIVGDEMGVKASGGVRTRKDSLLMLNAGASRIGASASVKILQELPALGQKAAKPASGGGY